MFKAYFISVSLVILLAISHSSAFAKDDNDDKHPKNKDQESQIEKDFYKFMREGKKPPSSRLYHTSEALAPGAITTATEVSVPEPTILALIGLGFAGLGLLRRKS
ncbi:MAG: PEP-CTERM sorting domain-containing protein [Methylococcaceae bacterium]|nr:PEP-CTERM sorting domain-containing protein [Methylococcaceae bacterium]